MLLLGNKLGPAKEMQTTYWVMSLMLAKAADISVPIGDKN